MIELYHWEPVSHSLRALICVEEAGVEYESHYVDLLEFQQFGSEFLSLNPAGQVPVLRNNGVAITESVLIAEYLAEAFPEAGLAPTDPLGWYEVQTWSKFIDYNLSSSLATLGCNHYLSPLIRSGDVEAMSEAVEAIPVEVRRPGWRLAITGDYSQEILANSRRKVSLVVERMEKSLANSVWLVGNTYSIADINTFAMIHGLRDLATEVAGDEVAPRTAGWYARIAERDAVKRALGRTTRHELGTVYAPGPEHSRWG